VRLSPFDGEFEKEWLAEAPLVCRRSYGGEHRHHFEIEPVHPDSADEYNEFIPRDEPLPTDYSVIGSPNSKLNLKKKYNSPEYYVLTSTFPRPAIRFHTEKTLKKEYGYSPYEPPSIQEVGWDSRYQNQNDWNEETEIELNKDTKELLSRLARLWNGEIVCGVHILYDKCPSIGKLTIDLDEDNLKQLYYDISRGRDFILTFGDANWVEIKTPFLNSTSLFRKKVWYDIRNKARTLINNQDCFNNLRGDPLEGLVHRVTVGLAVLHDYNQGWKTDTYRDINVEGKEYTIDALSEDTNGNVIGREIVTDHNNWQLHRETYRKLSNLNDCGIRPVMIFDSRDTAYKVFNHFHNSSLAELPHGTFNSKFNISAGRKQIQNAYSNSNIKWDIADWTTTWKLKSQILDEITSKLTRQQIANIHW
jgi:hypothetical protein